MIQLTKALAVTFTFVGALFTIGHLVVEPIFYCNSAPASARWGYPPMIVLGAILYGLDARLAGLAIADGLRQFGGTLAVAVVTALTIVFVVLIASLIHHAVLCR